MKRKHSKPSSVNEQSKALLNRPVSKKVEESEDCEDFYIFMQKIEETSDIKKQRVPDDVVKMSMKIDSSLSMDPFL